MSTLFQNPLLDDLQDETTQVLIEAGNLRKRVQVHAPFSPTWTHAGYLARIQHSLCACGNFSSTLLGVYSRETGAHGETRDTLLRGKWQIPLDRQWPVEISETYPDVCPACISGRGFAYTE